MYPLLQNISWKIWIIFILTIISTALAWFFYGYLIGLVNFLFGIIVVLYIGQDILVYYPYMPPDSRKYVGHPSVANLPCENIKIRNKDGIQIHMFLIKQSINGDKQPTMIFFHGNAGNMGLWLSNVSGFYHKLKINILLVEYRGYGLSEGSPSEQGLYRDAQSAIDYIQQRSDIDGKRIIIFGRSLGGAIAIDVASRSEYKHKIWALIVENTFTSIPDMALIVFKCGCGCLKWLPQFCYKNKYLSSNKIGQVVSPTLIICGSEDDLVPPRMGMDLYERCGALFKKMAVIPGGGHDDTWTCRDYYASLEEFLVNVPPLPGDTTPYSDIETNSLHHILVHTV